MLGPVQLHAVLELLGHPVRYESYGFHHETDWTARVVLRSVVAYDSMVTIDYERPGGQKPVTKTQRAQAMERAAFDALAEVLADHPRAPLGKTPSEVEKNIGAAIETVNAQEA